MTFGIWCILRNVRSVANALYFYCLYKRHHFIVYTTIVFHSTEINNRFIYHIDPRFALITIFSNFDHLMFHIGPFISIFHVHYYGFFLPFFSEPFPMSIPGILLLSSGLGSPGITIPGIDDTLAPPEGFIMLGLPSN